MPPSPQAPWPPPPAPVPARPAAGVNRARFLWVRAGGTPTLGMPPQPMIMLLIDGFLDSHAAYGEPGSEDWCAVQFWLGHTALQLGDPAASLSHFIVLHDAALKQDLGQQLVKSLVGRSGTLLALGRRGEATEQARRAFELAGQLGYPFGEAAASGPLIDVALDAGDVDGAVRLARQAAQITGIPGSTARFCRYRLAITLIEAGNLAAAEPVCAAALAQARETDDLWNQISLLPWMVIVDLEAGRIDEAAAHLRESVPIGRMDRPEPVTSQALWPC
jgi:tetratricopeptide (TPR) repeat protein